MAEMRNLLPPCENKEKIMQEEHIPRYCNYSHRRLSGKYKSKRFITIIPALEVLRRVDTFRGKSCLSGVRSVEFFFQFL